MENNLMWKRILVLALLSLAFNYELEDDVFVLNGDNFDEWLAEYSDHLRLTEFYAPWCGHCKALAPAYAEAAKKLKANKAPIVLAKIDATEDSNAALSARFEIGGYPTLKLFKSGQSEPVDYEGPREADGIIQYLESKIVKLEVLDSVEELTQLRQQNPGKFVVAGVFPKDSPMKQMFVNMQPESDFKISFGYFEGGDLSELLSANQLKEEGILLFNPQVISLPGKGVSDVTADSTETLNALIRQTVIENAPIVDQGIQKAVFELNQPLGMYLTNECNEVMHGKQIKYIYNRLKKAEQQCGCKIGIACKDQLSGLVSEVGKDSQDNVLLVVKDGKNYVFPQSVYRFGKFDMEGLNEFCKKFSAGELQPHIKSQEVGEEYENDVRVMVGSNVEAILEENKDKDVLLFMYASWCGHCKAVHPTIEQLAGEYKGTNVVIAKIDAAENYYPQDFKIEGFPTFYFIPAGGEVQQYQGGRELADFKQFIEANAASVKAEL